MTKQSHSGSPETNPTTSITGLRAALIGRVISSDAAGYDEARKVFYAGIDRRPAVIIRVASAADVSQVVSFARDRSGPGRPQRRPQPCRSQRF
jgi:hypothetical protein